MTITCGDPPDAGADEVREIGVLRTMCPALRPATIWEGRGGGLGLTTVGGGVDPPRMGRVAARASWERTVRPESPSTALLRIALRSFWVEGKGNCMAVERSLDNSVLMPGWHRCVVTR